MAGSRVTGLRTVGIALRIYHCETGLGKTVFTLSTDSRLGPVGNQTQNQSLICPVGLLHYGLPTYLYRAAGVLSGFFFLI